MFHENRENKILENQFLNWVNMSIISERTQINKDFMC